MSMKSFIKFFCCKFLFSVHYDGLENLPSNQNCLICPNHSSIFDPFFIYPVSHNLHIMAKSELFKHKLLAKLLNHYNVFPINRNKRDPGSLFHSLDIFNDSNGTQLLIFPEGGVLKTEEEIGKRIRNGAVYIASKMNIPIIPVYITRRPKFFSKVTVHFGKSICYDSSISSDKILVKNHSKQLIDTIYLLRK